MTCPESRRKSGSRAKSPRPFLGPPHSVIRRDRDTSYGRGFPDCVRATRIEEVLTGPCSPGEIRTLNGPDQNYRTQHTWKPQCSDRQSAERSSLPPWACVSAQAQSATQAGRLTCQVAPSVGAVVGSRRRISCKYMTNSEGGRVESYSGTITRFGLDIGFTAGGIITWTVLARTRGPRRGALASHYISVIGDISLGPGVGAKALIGGSRRTTELRPVPVVGKVGANLALGVAGPTLRFEN